MSDIRPSSALPAEPAAVRAAQRGLRLARLGVAAVDSVAAASSFLCLIGSIVSLLVTFGYTVAGVLGRYTGWFTVLGADQIGSYALASIFFLGVAHTFRVNGFVRVGFVYGRLTARRRVVFDVAFYAIALGASTLLSYYFWEYVLASYRFGTMSIGVPQVHLWIPQLSMAVGTSVLALQTFSLLLQTVVHGRSVHGEEAEIPFT